MVRSSFKHSQQSSWSCTVGVTLEGNMFVLKYLVTYVTAAWVISTIAVGLIRYLLN